jgi:outer membrane lipoprotein-sorting protein
MKTRLPKNVLCATVLSLCFVNCTAADDAPQSDLLSVAQILERMGKTYADCKTYRDTGTVKTEFLEPTGNFTTEKRFRTAFVRPDRFRFEFQETENNVKHRYVVWSKGTEHQTWWDIQPGVKKPDSLASALSAATGVSGGSARMVPALLLPTAVKGWKLTDLKEAKRGDDAEIGKLACFRVRGMSPTDKMTIWIDKKSYLTRRIELERASDTTTMTYEPVMDENLNEKLLEFDVPPKK